MAFGQTPADSGGIPLGTVYVPNSGLCVLQGTTNVTTDGSGNVSAPAWFARQSDTLYLNASNLKTANGDSGDLAVGPYAELAVDVSITGNQGTTPAIQFYVERKGADGVYYPLWDSNPISSASTMSSTSIGAGCAISQSFGSTVRFRWVITGSSTPGFTFSASVIGK